MTLAQILTAAASYLGKTTGDLTVNSLDLGLLALNQVRTTAELTHDFEFNRKLVTVTVDGVTGGSLDDAVVVGSSATTVTDNIKVTLAGTNVFNGTYTKAGIIQDHSFYVNATDPFKILWRNEDEWVFESTEGTGYVGYASLDEVLPLTPDLVETWQEGQGVLPLPTVEKETIAAAGTVVEVKSIVDIGTFDANDNLRPIEWTTAAESLERQYNQVRPVSARYPTDQEATALEANARITVVGRDLYLVPKSVSTQLVLGLEVYSMTADWTTTASSYAPWTTKGSQFLLWQTVLHLNQLFKEFVPRQEGNLAPPKDLADEGLQALLTWDIMQFEQARRHARG